MPAPTQDFNHAAEAVGLLTSRYINTKVTAGIVKAIGLRFQEIERDYWSLLNGALLANAPMAGGPWNIYDQLGAIVGVARNGRSDANYIPAIKIQIRIDRSQGLSEDIIQITRLVAAPGTTQAYYDWPLYAWETDLFLTTPDVVVALTQFLHQAAAETSAGNIRYTLGGWGSLIMFGDTYTPSAGAGFGSSHGGAPARVWAALGDIT